MLFFFLSLVYADISSDLQQASDAKLEDSLRQDAFSRLVRDGNADAQPLITRAQDTEEDVQKRWIAIRALGQIGGKKVTKELQALLKDKKSEVRMAACSALAESRQWSTTDSLLPLLEDQVLLVRVASAQALGKIGNPAAIAALDKALRAPEHFHRGKSLWVRSYFVEALAAIRNKKAYSSLLYAVDDQDPLVYRAAFFALEQIAGFALSEGRNEQEEKEAWKRWLAKELSK